MIDIHFDPGFNDDERRRRTFAGTISVVPGHPASHALVAWARDLIDAAFAGHDPRTAQHELEVAAFIDVVAPLKSEFTNSLRTKELIRQLLTELGCDTDATYFDVPRLRVVPSNGYLASGVSYAYGAHRDTWYAAPQCQVNYWTPVFDVDGSSAMFFLPAYWGRPIQNSSDDFDYDEWNTRWRSAAKSQGATDERPHPVALEPVDDGGEIRLVPPPAGLIAFSGAQLHGTAPNTSGSTRFSIDFRTLHLDDLRTGAGASLTDERGRPDTIVDFVRTTDFRPLDLTGVTS